MAYSETLGQLPIGLDEYSNVLHKIKFRMSYSNVHPSHRFLNHRPANLCIALLVPFTRASIAFVLLLYFLFL